MTAEQMIQLAINEVADIEMIDASDVQVASVIRVSKAYPAYFGGYDRFDVLRDCLDKFDHQFLIGRNGMHKHDNQDHSMLTGIIDVGNIISGREDKSNIWK